MFELFDFRLRSLTFVPSRYFLQVWSGSAVCFDQLTQKACNQMTRSLYSFASGFWRRIAPSDAAAPASAIAIHDCHGLAEDSIPSLERLDGLRCHDCFAPARISQAEKRVAHITGVRLPLELRASDEMLSDICCMLRDVRLKHARVVLNTYPIKQRFRRSIVS